MFEDKHIFRGNDASHQQFLYFNNKMDAPDNQLCDGDKFSDSFGVGYKTDGWNPVCDIAGLNKIEECGNHTSHSLIRILYYYC